MWRSCLGRCVADGRSGVWVSPPFPASLCSRVETLPHMGSLTSSFRLWGYEPQPFSGFVRALVRHLYPVPCSPRPWLRPYSRLNKLPEPSTCPHQPHFHGGSRRSCCHTLAWGLCPPWGTPPSSLPLCSRSPIRAGPGAQSISWTVSLIPT